MPSKDESPIKDQLKNLASSAQAGAETESSKIPTPPAALTPEVQAYTSAMITDAVKAVFASMAPMLQSIALTPEKMAEAERLRRAPDPAAVARELRERKLLAEEIAENERRKIELQNSCGHKYITGQSSVNLIRNYPDRQSRGICVLCAALIHPREWRIGAPDSDNPRGRAYVAEAHPQYKLVLEAAQSKG